jgi:hypothetical protein
MKLKFDRLSQFLLPFLTIVGFLLISLKMPRLGLPIQLLAQVIWLYSGYQAWKKADQIGIFISAIALTIIVLFGVINYWFIK